MRRLKHFILVMMIFAMMIGSFIRPIIAQDNQGDDINNQENTNTQNGDGIEKDDSLPLPDNDSNDNNRPATRSNPEPDQTLTIHLTVDEPIDYDNMYLNVTVFPFEDKDDSVGYCNNNNVFYEPRKDGDGNPYHWFSINYINDEVYIYIEKLYPGQEYKLIFHGISGTRKTISYLCKAGVEKSHTITGPSPNAIQCVVHDKNKPGEVTNPSKINQIDIALSHIPDVEYQVPLHIEWENLKGAIAQGCNQLGYMTLDNTLYFTSDYSLFESQQTSGLARIINEARFTDTGETVGDKSIISYDNPSIIHTQTKSSDFFTLKENITLPISYYDITHGETNIFYLKTKNYEYNEEDEPAFFGWRIEIDVDDDLNETDCRIYMIRDGYNDIPKGKKVESIFVKKKDNKIGYLTIANSSPSMSDDEFEYEIIVYPSTNDSGPYRVTKNNESIDSFYANTPFAFKLKHKESIRIAGLTSGSEYKIKQKKKDGVDTVAATQFNSKDYRSLELVEEGDYYCAGTIGLEANVVFEYRENASEQPPPVICPPVPTPDGYAPVYFGMSWSNKTKDDTKIKIKKYNPILDQNPTQQFADVSLAGAEFTLIGTDNSFAVLYTDKNGEVVFDGLDKEVAYVIVETKAPKGFMLPGRIAYVYLPENYDEQIEFLKNDIILSRYRGYMEEPIVLEENEGNIKILEPLASSKLEVKKVLLLDESKYNGPMFEIKHFSYFNKDNDPNLASYREYIWQRSFFEDMQGIEFVMTLDSDPDNPRYTYHATTDDKGYAVFKRVAPLESWEYEGAEYLVFYGKYTIKEINTPEGIRKMEDQHVEFLPSSNPWIINSLDEVENRTSVMRVVNQNAVGELKIQKQVKGSSADKNKEFKFTVTFKDSEGVELDDEFTYKGSKEGTIKSGDTITLKHNEHIIIKGIKDGTEYTVIEEKYEEYTTTVNNKLSSEISGTILDNKTIELKFVNEIPEKPKYEPPKTGIE